MVLLLELIIFVLGAGDGDSDGVDVCGGYGDLVGRL
jgi:hypothetical protein